MDKISFVVPDLNFKKKLTCLLIGKKARFFVKSMKPYDDEYASEHYVEFER